MLAPTPDAEATPSTLLSFHEVPGIYERTVEFFYMANIQDGKKAGFNPITILRLRLQPEPVQWILSDEVMAVQVETESEQVYPTPRHR
jgi:hypothetical protein